MAHPWLETSVYEPLRQRTISLVKQSVDALLAGKHRVSLSTIALKSKELDPEHRGISESAILDNQEARAYYEQHRSWRSSQWKPTKPSSSVLVPSPRLVKSGRDELRVRQRYLRMGKDALVERLITTERLMAEQRERWLGHQDQTLVWQMRAETAEAQLQELQQRDRQRKEM